MTCGRTQELLKYRIKLPIALVVCRLDLDKDQIGVIVLLYCADYQLHSFR